ncbi:MAG: hypothetical protein GKS06_14725 [Acidobacteria bacterium]|nr:hypothetical protein [Acidobacteriota bacterium]
MEILERIGVAVFALALMVATGCVQRESSAGTQSTAGAGSGRLEVRQVDGPSLVGNQLGIAATRQVSIYLPPSYAVDTGRRYPTLYLLHGIFDTDTTWTRPWPGSPIGFDSVQALMDRGIAAGALAEMIVVMPDAEKTCHYTNSPLMGDWEDFIARDLTAFVDSEYRTLDAVESRGIAGHSMGGHGAIKVGMRNTDVFSAIYGLSPSLLDWAADLSVENAALAGLASLQSESDLQNAHFYVQAIVGIGRCFSPDADDPPFLTDMPFTAEDGQVRRAEPGFERWTGELPLHLIGRHADGLRQLRGFRFDAGDAYQFTHIPVAAQAFSDALAGAGIEHRFDLYEGDHRNRLWGSDGRLYAELFPFFSQALASR